LSARRLSLALRCILSATLIIFVLRKLDWRELFQILGHLDCGWALAGCAMTSLLVVGYSVRWRIFLEAQGIHLPFGAIVSLTWAGQFFNSILPGSTGGDVVKIYHICQMAPDRKAAAAATVLVDRITALFALLLLAGVGLIINPIPLRVLIHSFVIGKTILWASVGLVATLVVAWFLFRAMRGTLWGQRLVRTLSAARRSFIFDGRWVGAFLLALAMHLVIVMVAYLFARALGLSMSYLQALIMMPVIALFVMLPITISGHGLRELLLIGYFTEMGVTLSSNAGSAVREIAIAFSLLMVANDLLWALPGGIWYLIRFKSARHDAPPPA
jgi:uncharacterized protein (TIRG00374 family)